MGVKMPNALYSNENLSRYLKSGYVIESENDEIAILVKRRKVGVFWNLVLTLITGGFWLLVWIPRLIFRNSVVRLYKDEVPAKQTGWLSRLTDQGIDKFQGLSSRGKLIAAGSIAVLLIIFFISGNTSRINEEKLAEAANYSTFQNQLETPVDPAYCGAIERVLEDGTSITFAKKNRDRAIKASDSLTVWNADSYLAKSDWVDTGSQLVLNFYAEQEVSTNKLLSSRITGLSDKLAEVGLKELDGSWGDKFRAFVVTDCGLQEQATSVEEKIREVMTAADVIKYKASSKPWYPKGFKETGFEGFAYQNISNQGCSYSFGSCAKFKIISKTSCPTNLYVRTNHLVNGAVDDWSNDTATVSAGQIAIMETTFNSDYSGSWEFVEINCY
jgi:hypothetical protein